MANIVVTPQDLNVMQDGMFKNTRLFAGTYEIWPFETCGYSCTEEEHKTIELNGSKTTKVELAITPYLTLQWVRESYQDTDGYIIRFLSSSNVTQMKELICLMWIKLDYLFQQQ